MENNSEEQALQLFLPLLQELCAKKWKNLDYEDRLMEAELAFICAFRILDTDSGNFIPNFLQYLDTHMKKANYRPGQRPLSLDAEIPTKNDSTGFSGYTICASHTQDESELYVKQLLQTLPETQQKIVHSLLNGVSKAEIARRHDMTVYKLNSILRSIGNQYIKEYG